VLGETPSGGRSIVIADAVLKLERATKNTYVFVEEGADSLIVGQVYIKKRLFHGRTPEKVKLSIEWVT
jgi:hypothetical protein